ncbi:MAG: hypothetical protein H0T39_03695 [Actinobacteria bacterium]|nr:hypothetical protein [Actinomycetota bacterium]
MFLVMIRLRDGDRLETGVFQEEAEARKHAEELIWVVGGERPAWPLIGHRYIRPDSIVSVDLSESSELKWLGSETRLMWAGRVDPSQSQA